MQVAGRIQACAEGECRGSPLVWRSYFHLLLMTPLWRGPRSVLHRRHNPAARRGKHKPCPGNRKGTRDSPRGRESKWPGHPTPFLLPSLLKEGCGKMGCVHRQASLVPTVLMPLAAATVRMDMRTASPPLKVNITGCSAVAVEGHLTPPHHLPQHFLPNTLFCLCFHPVWAPSCLSPEGMLRKHCIL